jgi:invasion protein IalB
MTSNLASFRVQRSNVSSSGHAQTPEKDIGFPLSLNGIGEGYDKLP